MDIVRDNFFMLRKHHLESFFRDPCDSKLLNIAFTSDNHIQNAKRKHLHHSFFYRKALCLRHEDGYVLLPMFHGVERQ